MKYITWMHPELGPVLVSFTGNLSHADVAEKLGVGRKTVRSAGFLTVVNGAFLCHGHSQSLGVGSLVSDTKLAENFFKL